MSRFLIWTTVFVIASFSEASLASIILKDCINKDRKHHHKIATIQFTKRKMDFVSLSPSEKSHPSESWHLDRCSKFSSYHLCYDFDDNEQVSVQFDGKNLKVWTDDEKKSLNFGCK